MGSNLPGSIDISVTALFTYGFGMESHPDAASLLIKGYPRHRLGRQAVARIPDAPDIIPVLIRQPFRGAEPDSAQLINGHIEAVICGQVAVFAGVDGPVAVFHVDGAHSLLLAAAHEPDPIGIVYRNAMDGIVRQGAVGGVVDGPVALGIAVSRPGAVGANPKAALLVGSNAAHDGIERQAAAVVIAVVNPRQLQVGGGYFNPAYVLRPVQPGGAVVVVAVKIQNFHCGINGSAVYLVGHQVVIFCNRVQINRVCFMFIPVRSYQLDLPGRVGNPQVGQDIGKQHPGSLDGDG